MIIRSIVGLFAFAMIAWVISEDRRKVDLRVVATGLVLASTDRNGDDCGDRHCALRRHSKQNHTGYHLA